MYHTKYTNYGYQLHQLLEREAFFHLFIITRPRMSAPSQDDISRGLSQLCKSLDGQEYVMGSLTLAGSGYAALGTALAAYRHVRYLDASANELGSEEQSPADAAAADAEEEGGEEGKEGQEAAADAEEGKEAAAPRPHALQALTGMTSLLAVNLSGNSVLTLPEGLSLPELQVADLRANRILAIPLTAETAPKLVSLDVSENSLLDVAGLDGLDALRSLNVSQNSVVSSLAELGALPALQTLAAAACALTDLAGLEGLSSACTSIDVSGNQIATLDGLEAARASLSGVKTLNLSENAIESLDELTKLAGLKSLVSCDLSGNPCADADEFRVEVVLRAPGLATVSGEPVTDEERAAAKELKAARAEEARLAAEAAAAAEAEAEAEEEEEA